jgi:ABC-2 type transport system ATP-binding protein
MQHGRIRAIGTPGELKAALGPTATMDDVFRSVAGSIDDEGGGIRDVRATRRTAGRAG